MSRIGRPAGPAEATEEVVLTAALDLLLVEGVAALTPQRLHQETGVSRSTIYRHWPTSTEVLAALIDVAPPPQVAPTGDPAHDLHVAVDQLCDRLRDKPVSAFLRALVSVDDLRGRYVADIERPFREALRATGVGRQQRDDAIAAIVGPLLADAVLADASPARARAHRAVDLHLAALSTGDAS
ncbi:TetR/AcrR family transcriptional regulator [Nocardioides sp.]|uniref:TetR/AcrR family transcriptional regulator n=1 Tax=Nocardioides sp. TaxID=35761 RepID=UPI0035646CC9